MKDNYSTEPNLNQSNQSDWARQKGILVFSMRMNYLFLPLFCKVPWETICLTIFLVLFCIILNGEAFILTRLIEDAWQLRDRTLRPVQWMEHFCYVNVLQSNPFWYLWNYTIWFIMRLRRLRVFYQKGNTQKQSILICPVKPKTVTFLWARPSHL